jgi:hypothetical protein
LLFTHSPSDFATFFHAILVIMVTFVSLMSKFVVFHCPHLSCSSSPYNFVTVFEFVSFLCDSFPYASRSLFFLVLRPLILTSRSMTLAFQFPLCSYSDRVGIHGFQ